MSYLSYVIQTYHFGDTYKHGLNGSRASWAARKYHGHRMLSDKIMEELDKAGMCRYGSIVQ